MREQEILSKYCSRRPSRSRGARWWINLLRSFEDYPPMMHLHPKATLEVPLLLRYKLASTFPYLRTGGKPIVSKRTRGNPPYSRLHPLGTWNSFWDAIKEQYYPVGSYEDKYIQWKTLRKQRDQDVHELMNRFHTLHTKLGIKYSEKHLVLKYRSFLHRYFQEETEFLDIPWLGATYQYAAKIGQKFKHKKWDFGSMNQKQGKGAPKP